MLRRRRAGLQHRRSARDPILLITDLHSDFTPGGVLAAPGAEALVPELGELITGIEEACRRGEPHRGYSGIAVVIEGEVWGRRPDTPPSDWPAHGQGEALDRIAGGLHPLPSNCFVWTGCPAVDSEPLSALAEGKGQQFSLVDRLEGAGEELHVAGLSIEHGGLPLTLALAHHYKPGGRRIVFRADLSTSLEPAQLPSRLESLRRSGVTVR